MNIDPVIEDLLAKIRFGEAFNPSLLSNFSNALKSAISSCSKDEYIEKEMAVLLLDIALVFASSSDNYKDTKFYNRVYGSWIKTSDEIRELLLS